jgi:hypothetical protein
VQLKSSSIELAIPFAVVSPVAPWELSEELVELGLGAVGIELSEQLA